MDSLWHSARIGLSKDKVWDLSGKSFETCKHSSHGNTNCWDRADMLQRICSTKSKAQQASIYRRLCPDGAVVFGEWKGKV